MTRPKALILISFLALVFAGIAAWLTHDYLQIQMKNAQAARPEKIVVAATDIAVGATITEAQLRQTWWPRDIIPPGSAQLSGAVIGRVAIRPIARGDAVTEQKLKPQSGARGSGFMTYLVPRGHRAVTVAVNEVVGVAGFLTPSDRVDVVVTTQLPGNNRENISKIFLENIPILATGQVIDQKEGKPVVVPTVTLDLTPADAEKLVLSTSRGPLHLLLRNIADSVQVHSEGATIEMVLSGSERRPPTGKALPARPAPSRKSARQPRLMAQSPPPPPSYTLEIIRGTEKSSRQYIE